MRRLQGLDERAGALTLWHGTKPENAEKIKREGLKPQYDWWYGDDPDPELQALAEPDAVYFAKSREDACQLGGAAIFKATIPRSWIHKEREMEGFMEVLVTRPIPPSMLTYDGECKN